MSTLTTAPNHLLLPPRLIRHLNFPAISLPPRTRRRRQRPQPPSVRVNLEKCSFGLGLSKRTPHYGRGSWCKRWDLEAEILEFMSKSEKPEAFPSMEELVEAGRVDLVGAIVKSGGWFSLGWDLEGKNGNRISKRIWVQEESPSSSGRSLEMGENEDTGIGGILNQLEKQRNLSFGINLGRNGYDDDPYVGTSRHVVSTLEAAADAHQVAPTRAYTTNSAGKFIHERSDLDFDCLKNSLNPELWRTWGIQRADFSDATFEVGENSFDDNQMREAKDARKEVIHESTEGSAEALDKQKEISHNEIRTRLRQLELELTSTLHLLRSNSFVPNEGLETFSTDLLKLSDALEFEENDITNAKDKLRSIRAKLAVLQGKMTLAIIDAQKVVEGKRKRIDGAHKALQLLRTACIVWPNSAYEVWLAGSYDGWITQRKMKKSKTGIFCVYLKLYPGRYEIKFIVDGVWKTDPIRPIVHNNGYKNNLLIIT